MAVYARKWAGRPGSVGPIYLIYYVCDLDSEKPTTGLNAGDLCMTLDGAAKFYRATGPTTWVETTGSGSTPSDSVTALDGTGAAGAATAYSRGDHKHGDVNRPADGEKAALVGTSGTPGSGNKFVTDGDSRNSNARTPLAHTHPESDITNLVADLAAKEATANKNAVSGYAGLDASSKLTGSQQKYGSAANTAAEGNDARLSDARTPLAHAASHKSGGSDAIKLDELAAPTDVTTLDASVSAHGLMKKYPGGTSTFLRADGTFSTPVAAAGDTSKIVANGVTSSILTDTCRYIVNRLSIQGTGRLAVEGTGSLGVG